MLHNFHYMQNGTIDVSLFGFLAEGFNKCSVKGYVVFVIIISELIENILYF